jgi:hypothetical protein
MGPLSLLDAIPVPLGPATYAEPFDPQSLLKMPANALVNAGYFVVAAYWLREASRWPAHDPRARDRGYFMAFALMAAGYGPLQFWRIVTQAHLAGVLDQWTTPPFFAFLAGWNLLRAPGGEKWRARLPWLLVASALSYGLVLFVENGFVIVLALHLALAIATSVEALRIDQLESLAPFALALLCCVGFVVLKEGDKVCDFLQIHFALRFVAAGYLARAPALAVA